jgi:hypothetical protein
VTPGQNQHHRNRLLAALGPRDLALLEPHLQIVPIVEGEFLHLPGDKIEKVYFLHSGIVSLMAISQDGNAISTASVGSEGAIGTIARTGFVRAFTRALVQAPGVVVRRTGGHTPGHSVVRLASGGDRLTFAGDAVFQVARGRRHAQIAVRAKLTGEPHVGRCAPSARS